MKTRIALIALLIIGSSAIHAQTIMNIHQSNGTVLQIPLNTIDSITYTIIGPGSLASIQTTNIDFNSITDSTAISGGSIWNSGGSLVTQRGICFGTTPAPTTANTTVISGSGTGSFTSNLSGLSPTTTYYVRAYAINSAGTAYGNEVSFTTDVNIVSNPGAGVTFDGYTYSSIVLGNGQEWMAQNLRNTSYANGDPIPNVTDNTQWANLSTDAWAHFNNDSQYENPYGKLYNWYAVNDPRSVCPTGWHVPSDAEWDFLRDYVGGEAVAGGKIKSAGTQYWGSPNTGATNESGLSARPGGFRQNYTGNTGNMASFTGIGVNGFFWSSTEIDTDNAAAGFLSTNYSNFYGSPFGKNWGCSVRCLKD